MSQPNLCRAILVEDHSIEKRCLSMLMARRTAWEVVGKAVTAAAALEQVAALR